jgi:hypothetical protein
VFSNLLLVFLIVYNFLCFDTTFFFCLQAYVKSLLIYIYFQKVSDFEAEVESLRKKLIEAEKEKANFVQINLHSQWHEPLGCIAFAKCRIEPQRMGFC